MEFVVWGLIITFVAAAIAWWLACAFIKGELWTEERTGKSWSSKSLEELIEYGYKFNASDGEKERILQRVTELDALRATRLAEEKELALTKLCDENLDDWECDIVWGYRANKEKYDRRDAAVAAHRRQLMPKAPRNRKVRQ